jgi:predicted transcriptional regulator
VAHGRDPCALTAADCMTPSVVTVDKETDVEDCERLMSQYQIRRILVTDAAGNCCGIIAQADIAIHAPEDEAGRVVQGVSS